MPYELCRHVKANGRRCQSPTLTDSFWCYFHARLHSRHRDLRSAKPSCTPTALTIPPIEDRESIQVALSLVIGAIASGHIDEKRAATILRGLQIACRNLGGDGYLMTEPYASSIVRSFQPTADGLNLAPRRMDDNSAPPKLSVPDPPLDPK